MHCMQRNLKPAKTLGMRTIHVPPTDPGGVCALGQLDRLLPTRVLSNAVVRVTRALAKL